MIQRTIFGITIVIHKLKNVSERVILLPERPSVLQEWISSLLLKLGIIDFVGTITGRMSMV